MVLSVTLLQSFALQDSNPRVRCFVVTIAAAGSESATGINALLATATGLTIASDAVVACAECPGSANLPVSLSAGALSIDPQTGAASSTYIIYAKV